MIIMIEATLFSLYLYDHRDHFYHIHINHNVTDNVSYVSDYISSYVSIVRENDVLPIIED